VPHTAPHACAPARQILGAPPVAQHASFLHTTAASGNARSMGNLVARSRSHNPMRRHAILLAAALMSLVAACMVRASPADKSVEHTLPIITTPATLPRQLRVVTFNVHRETPDVVIHGVRSDPTLLDADLIILEEVHRVEPSADPCSAACALGKELHMYTHYAPASRSSRTHRSCRAKCSSSPISMST
jgi:hypothetical protein